MFDTSAIAESFGRAAPHYDAHAPLQHAVRRQAAALAAPHFAPGALVLDLGAGTGAFAGEHRQWRVVSLDIAPAMCAAARAHGPAVAAQALRLPFADGAFNGVFSSLMLQWVDTPGEVFSEIARVLRPGGHAAVATLAEGTLDELREAFATVDAAPHVSDFAAPHALMAAADAAGLALRQARLVPVTEHYPDAIALMRGLQAIGATNKRAHRRRGLMTPAQFARVEAAYEPRRRPQGLPASWQVLHLLLERRA